MYWHQFRSIFKSISLEQLQRCLLQCHPPPPPFTHKNENEKWPTLGVKNIADKNLLLCCHLFVELLQRLPVEGSLPLVSTLHPSAGVEVEDTLQFVVQITLNDCLWQSGTNLGCGSPIRHLVPKVSFRMSHRWPPCSCLTAEFGKRKKHYMQ